MTENSENHGNTGLRTLLWVVLIVSVAGNALTSSLGIPLFVSITLGVVALVTGTVLAVQHYRQAR
jgi:hypothetical protein